MFDHVGIRVRDEPASRAFYDVVLGVLGLEVYEGDDYVEWGDFAISAATDEQPASRRLHIAFFAPSQGLVETFWRVGTGAGYRSDGEPGPRPQYSPDYYGAFLLDPDGNSVEAVFHGAEREQGTIDHLWLRTRDLAGAKRFYEAVAPHARLRLNHDGADRVQFVGEASSFSFVPGEPTEEVHIAFPARTNNEVDVFHRELVAAGYRDNGGPGERPQYHVGYYGAFVLDPDGHNVELVNHNR